MKHRYLFKASLTAVVVGVLLAGPFPYLQARAGTAGEARPLQLRKIMQTLGKDMQAVTNGIAREDWGLVAKTAPRIADHPQPSMGERMRILAFVGSDVGEFKQYDKWTHDAARALEQAAIRGDGQAVISSFATLQTTCLGCHQQFRTPFRKHFDQIESHSKSEVRQ